MDPFTLQLSKIIYEERLQKAVPDRRSRTFKISGFEFSKSFRSERGQQLDALVRRLRSHMQSQSPTSA